MDDSGNLTFLPGLLIATASGLIIGLEREFKATLEKDSFAGIRTYPLIAILGYSTTVLALQYNKSLLLVVLPAFIVLLITTYFVRSQKGHSGITSELAMIITFCIGVFVALQFIREALAVTVITITLLSLKGKFKSFVGQLTQQEIYAFVRFSILALLILPFLPDEYLGPYNLINPRTVGSVVVIISSLSFAGYLMIKFFDHRKGILLTAVFGGLFSSTGVTWVFAARSREDQSHSVAYATGIVLASCIMFLRVIIVTVIFNFSIFKLIVIPCLVMAVTGLVAAFIIMRRQAHIPNDAVQINLGNPVNLLNAFGFGLLYIFILFMVHYGNLLLGDKGLLLSGIISGLADVDAITIAMADYAQSPAILPLAGVVILSAILSNTVVKTGVAWMRGSQDMRYYVIRAMAAVLAAGLLGVMLLWLFYAPDGV